MFSDKTTGPDASLSGDAANTVDTNLHQALTNSQSLINLFNDYLPNLDNSSSKYLPQVQITASEKSTDRQFDGDYYHKAAIETINKMMQKEPGQLYFDTDNKTAPTLSDRLITQFKQELDSGTLSKDPLWLEFATWQKDIGQSGKDMLQLLTGDSSAITSFVDSHHQVAKSLDARNKEQQAPVDAERKHLTEWAKKNLSPDDQKHFIHDMETFEQRARSSGLSPDEVLKTYQQVERLANASGDKPLAAEDRIHVAETIMHLAAVPTDVCQGYNNTCNVASLESRTYTRTPSAAAKLVADVALTGQYTSTDGTVVKVDPKPDREAQNWPTLDGDRSHAGELFQLTAVNLYYSRQNRLNGTDLHYEKENPQNGDPGDTGERLYDYSSGHKVPVKENTYFGFGGVPVRGPEVTTQMIADLSDLIVGKNEKDVVLDARRAEGYRGLTPIHSEDELRAKLAELKANHRLPVIIGVDTNNEPFFTDSGRGTAGGSGGGHDITITDYDEKTGNVCIDNQWNKSADHGANNPVNVHDVYIAMHWSKDAEKLLKQDVDYNRSQGKPDRAKEIDLVRHELIDGTISKAQAEKETAKIIDEMSDQKKAGKLNEGAEERDWIEVEALVHQLDPAAQAHLMKQAHDEKLISDQRYEDEKQLISLEQR